MKEIKAYIHNHRIADVIHALKESGQCNVDPAKGCRNLSVSEVRCLLKSHNSQERHYAVDLAEEVINESKLELICEDDQVDELMGIIERAARTDQPEAGWIYVMEVSSAVRIGER